MNPLLILVIVSVGLQCSRDIVALEKKTGHGISKAGHKIVHVVKKLK